MNLFPTGRESKIHVPGAGERPPWLTAPAVHSEGLGSIHSRYMVARSQSVTPVPEDRVPSFGLSRHCALYTLHTAQHTRGTETNVRANT